MNYNAVLILEAIAKAPIPDEVKLKAVNDLEKMYTDKEYGEKCDVWFWYNSVIIHESGMSLRLHHLWDRSDLGFKFWDKLVTIILS